MKYFKQLLKEKSVLFLLIPFLLGMSFLLITYGKGPTHLLVNTWNSPMADVFFKYFTNLGDGVVFAIVIIILAFIRFRWALYELVAALLTLIFVYITKKHIFKGMPRPSKYFDGISDLHLVEGVKMHSSNSFPSGHTITAFAIFFILVLIAKNKSLKFIFVLTAILAGWSRVYLSQHFVGDVLTGAIIGIMLAIFSCWIVDNSSIFKTSWIDKNVLQLKKKNEE